MSFTLTVSSRSSASAVTPRTEAVDESHGVTVPVFQIVTHVAFSTPSVTRASSFINTYGLWLKKTSMKTLINLKPVFQWQTRNPGCLALGSEALSEHGPSRKVWFI